MKGGDREVAALFICAKDGSRRMVARTGADMRFLKIILALLALVGATPAFSQTAPASRQHQLDLAERYLELTQGPSMSKIVRRQIEEAYAKSEMPDEQREWWTDNMAQIMETVLSATMVDLRDDVADLFTTAELEALVNFYDTPLGASVADKSLELSVLTQEAMAPHLLKAMESVLEKYCLRFDCGAGLDGSAKLE